MRGRAPVEGLDMPRTRQLDMTLGLFSRGDALMRTLTEIFNENFSDKGTVMEGWEAHGYSPLYEQWFDPIREQPIRLLEIGVCDPRKPGASLVSWYEYFPTAQIFGYDIVDATEFDNDRIKTFMGDQSSPTDLQRFVDMYGGDFDIIIDDGSHIDAHQQARLAFLFQFVKPGGQYVVEDMQVSPNTLEVLKEIQKRRYSPRNYVRQLVSRLRHTAPRPLVPQSALRRIQANTTSVDILCNDKLGRLVKRK